MRWRHAAPRARLTAVTARDSNTHLRGQKGAGEGAGEGLSCDAAAGADWGLERALVDAHAVGLHRLPVDERGVLLERGRRRTGRAAVAAAAAAAAAVPVAAVTTAALPVAVAVAAEAAGSSASSSRASTPRARGAAAARPSPRLEPVRPDQVGGRTGPQRRRDERAGAPASCAGESPAARSPA